MTVIFSWSEAFLTDLPSVDDQHHRLIDLINDLAQWVTSAEALDQQQFTTMRETLLDYAVFHFRDEESQMRALRLDQRYFAFHCEQHQAFLDEVSSLSQVNSISIERARTLVEYLFHWLAHHILQVDQSMARQLRAIRDGVSPAEAYQNDAQVRILSTDPLLAALSALYQIISERNRELRSLNRELEQRVRQRTLDLEDANRQLQLLSTHDELTGLPNRRFANLSLDRFWSEMKWYGGSLSVLILDADHFKQVNDRFGHAEGDTLLRVLATRLRDAVRQCDVVCRLGGDEFLVICLNTSQSQAANVARKILGARQPFYTADGMKCWDGALSIGIAEAGSTMTRPGDLLRAADQALYVAKQNGGACMAVHGV